MEVPQERRPLRLADASVALLKRGASFSGWRGWRGVRCSRPRLDLVGVLLPAACCGSLLAPPCGGWQDADDPRNPSSSDASSLAELARFRRKVEALSARLMKAKAAACPLQSPVSSHATPSAASNCASEVQPNTTPEVAKTCTAATESSAIRTASDAGTGVSITPRSSASKDVREGGWRRCGEELSATSRRLRGDDVGDPMGERCSLRRANMYI